MSRLYQAVDELDCADKVVLYEVPMIKGLRTASSGL